jgi:hypothetical protein
MNKLRDFLAHRWAWVLAALVLLILFVQFGGVTIVVRNQALQPICEVHVSTESDQADWGPNRLWSQLRSPQSRDIRLPVSLTFFIPAEERTLYTWAIGCDGDLIETAQFRGGDSLFLWEVNGQ